MEDQVKALCSDKQRVLQGHVNEQACLEFTETAGTQSDN